MAHEVATLAAGFHQPLGLQLVVGRDHRVGADTMGAGAFAHRGQAGAWRHQVLLDALGEALHQLFGQGLTALAAQRRRQRG